MEKKTFAFKLAEKRESSLGSGGGKWKARDGVSLASCTELLNGNYRANEKTFPSGPPCPPDEGYYC
jgi:hypothetical protein